MKSKLAATMFALFHVFAIASVPFALSACERDSDLENAAEDAGDAAEDAADDAEDAVDDAMD